MADLDVGLLKLRNEHLELRLTAAEAALEERDATATALRARVAELEKSQATVLLEIEKDERFCLEGIANPVLDETTYYYYQGKTTVYDKVKKLLPNPPQNKS